jgi:hypothetical protein
VAVLAAAVAARLLQVQEQVVQEHRDKALVVVVDFTHRALTLVVVAVVEQVALVQICKTIQDHLQIL